MTRTANIELLKKLDEMQREAALSAAPILRLVACAGTGKTTVLTARALIEADRLGGPERVTVITFTRKAAQELVDRLDSASGGHAKGMFIGTFHRLCAKILRENWEHVGRPHPGFTIIDNTDANKIIKDILIEKCPSYAPEKDYIDQLREAISARQNAREGAGIPPRDHEPTAINTVMLFYEKYLTDHCLEDFGSLINRATEFLETNHPSAEAIKRSTGSLLVDEFQDTNFAQAKFIEAICSRGGRLTIVGDPDQSIYAFRGSRPSLMSSLEGNGIHTATMELNRRSAPAILDLANKSVRSISNRGFEKTITPFFHDRKGHIRHWVYENEYAEGNAIANKIKKLVEAGVDPGEIAVLGRTHSSLKPIEDGLIRARVPHALYRGVSFTDRAEVKDLSCFLRTIVNTRDVLALERILNKPKRGLGEKATSAIMSFVTRNDLPLYEAMLMASDTKGLLSAKAVEGLRDLAEILADARRMYDDERPAKAILEEIIERTGYRDYVLKSKGDKRDPLLYVDHLIAIAEDVEDTAVMVQELGLATDHDLEEAQGKVNLMTLHASKGLEFDHVFMPAMEEGVFPTKPALMNGSPMAIDEERRLFHVGITRARKGLYISRCETRHSDRTGPSMLLYEIGLVATTLHDEGLVAAN